MHRKETLRPKAKEARRPRHRPATDVPFLDDFVAYAWAQLQAGNAQEAMEMAVRAVRMAETDASKSLFMASANGWSYFPGAEQISDIVSRALIDVWGKRSDLIGLAFGILNRDPAMQRLTTSARRAWPARVPIAALLDGHSLTALANSSLLNAILRSGKIYNDLAIERALTLLRSAFLDMALDGAVTNELAPLACALAEQCFLNEYVFDQDEIETGKAATLQDRVETAARERSRANAFPVAVLGCYRPLECVPQIEKLVSRIAHAPLTLLVGQQVQEARQIGGNKRTISQLTKIEQKTSVNVRGQYEQNPYPRWRKAPKTTARFAFEHGLATQFPGTSFRAPPKGRPLDVLIAGCGTGQHAVLFAQNFADVSILAIDLSMNSLAYAKIRSDELGLDNIAYAQADILELDPVDRSFDVISSSGVLHHLAEPEHGLRKLVSLLRPDGFMHIGLYSETARTSVTAAKEWLSARGYTGSVADIRRGRQAVIDTIPGHPAMSGVLEFGDFYSTSECRDLLFHVQETNFTLARVQRALDENGLTFIGFLVPAQVRELFLREFSPAREHDLAAWAEFEARYPATFRGMYEFWAQRSR